MLMQQNPRTVRNAVTAMALTLLVSTSMVASVAFAAYKTPGQVPAMMSRLAAVTPLVGVAKAGKRIVAVGLHGHIVYSDDEGKTWTQAPSPVSSDLVAVSFPDEKNGWAVGHEGIVLHTSDGGTTWEKQLDGKTAAELTLHHFASKTGADLTPDVERAARQAKALVDETNTQTLLDVAFETDKVGYVVGTFNRIFRTEDGGKTWTPLMDRTNNPKELHFYAIQTDGKDTYLAGEQGLVWRVDTAKGTFTPLQTPYNGTLFGLIVDGPNLITYGMRGSLLRSGDAGKTWERVPLGNQAGISGGVVLPDGQIAIANQAGSIMLSADKGKTFRSAKVAKPMSYFGIKQIADRKVVVVGSEGVRVETLQ
jgi:photosystem II stability/assembly factor-like uncharacterized protein